MADGIGSFDPLKYGTSTGGAAGQGETTSTLGVDHKDVTTPPDVYHISNEQISQLKRLLALITADSKGGTRALVRTQSSNPFGINESGFYIDTAGVPYSVFNGTRTAIPFGQLVTATFAAVDSVAVTWSNIGGTQYVFQGVPNTTDGNGPGVIDMINKTSTGCTLRASGPWTGSVSLSIISV